MSQKPVARRTAMVMRSAFAITGSSSSDEKPSGLWRVDRFGKQFSFECLVLAEIGDGDPERVDRNQFVGNLGFEDKNEVRRIEVALELAVVGGRVVDQIEVDSRA